MFFSPRSIHFTGIGGIGMSGLAELLLGQGFPVSGSDVKASATTDRLAARGATISIGHRAENAAGASVVVATSAVKPDNPEVEEARRLRIPVVRRGALLAEMMRASYGIAIAGSHGKTTTTGMTATVLEAAGLDPTAVVGGRLPAWDDSNVRAGHGRYFVTESDESDGSFLLLSPVVCVITNIDHEHLDHWGTFENVRRGFAEFADKVPFYGLAVVCKDDENVRGLLPELHVPLMSYGTTDDCDVTVSGIQPGRTGTRFSLRAKGEPLGDFELPLLGRHNVLNATSAVCIARHLGIPLDVVRRALAGFHGVKRRLEIVGVERGITVADDYGHHPTEIRATLAAARQGGYPHVHVLFQPHRYTRTRDLLDQFTHCFGDADSVSVLDIYAASEAPIAGVSAEALVECVRAAGHKNIAYASGFDEAIKKIAGMASGGDLVLTLGAGNVCQAGPAFLAYLRGGS